MDDFEARKVAHVDGLLGEGKDAGNEGLRRNDGRAGRQRHHGIEQSVRHQAEKRLLDFTGMEKHERSLAEIIEEQRRED
jgi:hypothetical protein